MKGLWLVFTLGSILSAIFPNGVGIVGKHGKVGSQIPKSSSRLIETYTNLTVPKKWFVYFYVMGFLGCLIRLLQLSTFSIGTQSQIMLMFTLQCSRRFFECLFTHFGDSKMHVSTLLIGFLHYYLIPWEMASLDDKSVPQFWSVIVWILFLIASYSQNHCNRILDTMKREQMVTKRYKVPRGFLFDYVCCPHYLCEIIVYLCLWLMDTTSMDMFLIFAWVVSNQVVVADFQYQFYREKEGEAIPSNWKRILPFVW